MTKTNEFGLFFVTRCIIPVTAKKTPAKLLRHCATSVKARVCHTKHSSIGFAVQSPYSHIIDGSVRCAISSHRYPIYDGRFQTAYGIRLLQLRRSTDDCNVRYEYIDDESPLDLS